MDDYKKLRADFERMKKNEHERITARVLAERAAEAEKIAGPDPRDAEIARLRAEVERLRDYERIHGVRSNEIGKLRVDLAAHKRALAAGPAAVRRQENVDVNTREAYARVVEVAQAAAMKEKP